MIQKTKRLGQTFTPENIVNGMLDMIGYVGENILQKHVIDNSCGDGSILKLVVKRYCEEYIKFHKSTEGLKSELKTYIHGIEIDDVYFKCIDNLNQVVMCYGVGWVEFDILHTNSLTVSKHDNKMDFVIGNPPYVRVHNLENTHELVREFSFTKKGMTDLYITFFELGLKMLKPDGKLIYITPISWLTSQSGDEMRRYLVSNKYNLSFVDFEHHQVFKGVTTYSLITMIDKSSDGGCVDIFKYNKDNDVFVLYENTSIKTININNTFFLEKKNDIDVIRDAVEYHGEKYVSVKNGFATLCDEVFYGVEFEDMSIDVVKSTTGKKTRCLFPYTQSGKELDYDVVMSNQRIKDYYLQNKDKLTKGHTPTDNRWIYFGRTQGLNDVCKEKYTLNMIVKSEKDFKINKVECGEGVYGGLYIVPEKNGEEYFGHVFDILNNKKVMTYIKSLKKYKSGGYYTFGSNEIEKYINYYIDKFITRTSEIPLW